MTAAEAIRRAWSSRLSGRRVSGRRASRAVTALVIFAGFAASCSTPSAAPHEPRTAPGAPTLPAAVPSTGAATSTTDSTNISSAGADWTTYGHDASRSGADTTSPPATNPHPAWTSTPLDGAVYAQPLVIGSSVIAATENNSLYSLNASTGKINWSRHLAPPVSGSSLPCGNIDPSGITGTPVADPSTRTLWVVSFSPPAAHTLWQIDLDNGQILGSRPADPPGADPVSEQQRGALTLAGGTVYIPYGGLYGDCGNFRGWLAGLSATSPVDRSMAVYKTPAERAGIWAPPGAVIDGAGDLLVATGNGLPANVPGDANSVIRLDPSLRVLARFTAPDFQHLSETDTDLGSISPVLLPGGNVLQVGKEGVGYLLPPNLGSPLETLHVCGGAFGAGAVAGDNIYLSCFDGLYSLNVSGTGRLSSGWSATGIGPGPPVVAGGVVWTIDRSGALDGFSRSTGAKVYSYPVAVAGSFPTLAAARGALFVADGHRIIAFAGV